MSGFPFLTGPATNSLKIYDHQHLQNSRAGIVYTMKMQAYCFVVIACFFCFCFFCIYLRYAACYGVWQ